MCALYIADVVTGSTVDGEGVRLTIFLAGCLHDCEGCFNKEYQSFLGTILEADELIDNMNDYRDLFDGITLSGGDPLFQYHGVLEFLKEFKKEFKDKTVWLYTGFLFEQIHDDIKELVDVIVDGKYNKELSPKKWCGSSNQRVMKKVDGKWEVS